MTNVLDFPILSLLIFPPLAGAMNDSEVQGYNNGNFDFEKIKNITEPELLVYKRSLKKGEKTLPKTEVDEYLKKCIPVIVKVKNPPGGNNDGLVKSQKISNLSF